MFHKIALIVLTGACLVSPIQVNAANAMPAVYLEEETEGATVSENTISENTVSENTVSENTVVTTQVVDPQQDKTNIFALPQDIVETTNKPIVVNNSKKVLIIILGVLVILETIALVILLLGKVKEADNKKEVPDDTPAPTPDSKNNIFRRANLVREAGRFTPSQGSHSLSIEVLSGNCLNPNKTFMFEDQLLIGRSSICNIVFNEPDVSKLHSRIYLQDGMCFLENLSLKKGTYLCDMQIQRVNRIDSGDTVQIGSAKFVVRF